MKKQLWLVSGLIMAGFLVTAPLGADMAPTIPDPFWAIGPSLSYCWSDNLEGPALGFDAVQSWAFFTYSGGMRYIFSRNDGNDFRGNNGLLTIFAEGTVCLPLPMGIGASYNWALNDSSGPGLHAYFSVPIPIPKVGYASIYFRPSWVWLNGNCEVINEWGIYFKFSNIWEAFDSAAKRRNAWRKKYLDERRKRRQQQKSSRTNSTPQGK